jgi:ribosome assembly protein RRB1
MGKKSKRNRSSREASPADDVKSSETPAAPALRRKAEEETPDNLRFEDPFPEEQGDDDDEEAWEDAGEDDDEDLIDNDEDGEDTCAEIIQSWNPLTGEALQPGQKLEMDATAYKMVHFMTGEWPSLSFDFVRDELGDARTRFPHSMIAVVGTQADRPDQNQLTVMKLSDLSKVPQETEDDILGEEYDKDGDSDDDESEDEIDLDPIMEHYSIPHRGGVNRVRTMPQRTELVATWSDQGTVNLFNIESIVQRFTASEGKATRMSEIPRKAFFSYSGHSTEGYALDWSSKQQGHLVSGDCAGSIHVWRPREEGGYAVSTFYDNRNTSGRSVEVSPSVEDLQWSPTEATVFASAECGGYVRVFDSRAPNKAMLHHKIHANGADVNVLSWNKLVSNLLATGGDDGSLAVWDLRHFSKSSPDPLARFTVHKTPITSVEWHPTDESMLSVSDDHGAYVYDLSVEEDETNTKQLDVPPQLLFVHCGSEQFKEVHWHPQISSCLMATALSGYSVFIPSNL